VKNKDKNKRFFDKICKPMNPNLTLPQKFEATTHYYDRYSDPAALREI